MATVAASAYVGGRVDGKASVQAKWDAQRAKDKAATLAANIEARAIEAKRNQEVQDAVATARKESLRARADADASRAAADGLRWAATSAGDRCAAGDTAAARRGAADGLAAVVAQCSDQYRTVAAVADAAIVAGQACERAYVGLTR